MYIISCTLPIDFGTLFSVQYNQDRKATALERHLYKRWKDIAYLYLHFCKPIPRNRYFHNNVQNTFLEDLGRCVSSIQDINNESIEDVLSWDGIVKKTIASDIKNIRDELSSISAESCKYESRDKPDVPAVGWRYGP